MQRITSSTDLLSDIRRIVGEAGGEALFVLTDETTRRECLPLLEAALPASAQHIIVGSGDAHKTTDSLMTVWSALSQGGATRHATLVNLGGGMVTDLGGFAAATFKRGIRFVNIPTTLLSMVDAAVGGKTGINFNGLKNEVGCFCDAEEVIIHTPFLRTLDVENRCSGFAEMLKHSLLETPEMLADHLRFDLEQPDYNHLQELVGQSIRTKQRIVAEDPHEQGIRKALNLGHTVGHAFESLQLERSQPVLHGYAVAWGLLCELFLSAVHCGFPEEQMRQTVRFIRRHYGTMQFTCDDYPHLYELMKHDKKNVGGAINFTLLGAIGDIRLNQHLTKEEVFEAFDFFREG